MSSREGRERVAGDEPGRRDPAPLEHGQDPLGADPRAELRVAALDRRIAATNRVGDRVVVDGQGDAQTWAIHGRDGIAARRRSGQATQAVFSRRSCRRRPRIRAANVGRSATMVPCSRFATSSWMPIRTTRIRNRVVGRWMMPALDPARGGVAGRPDERLEGGVDAAADIRHRIGEDADVEADDPADLADLRPHRRRRRPRPTGPKRGQLDMVDVVRPDPVTRCGQSADLLPGQVPVLDRVERQVELGDHPACLEQRQDVPDPIVRSVVEA